MHIEVFKKERIILPPPPQSPLLSVSQSQEPDFPKSEEITIEKMTNSLFTKDEILKIYLNTRHASQLFSIK
jgi:hypothetical protein